MQYQINKNNKKNKEYKYVNTSKIARHVQHRSRKPNKNEILTRSDKELWGKTKKKEDRTHG
jgi:hypothetical protein